MPSVRVFYADVALVHLLLCDLAWVWATAVLAGVPARLRRLLPAALLAAVGELAAEMGVHALATLWGWGLLLLLMLTVAFGLGPWRRFLRVTLAALAAGIAINGGVLLLASYTPVTVGLAHPRPGMPPSLQLIESGTTLAQLGMALLLVAGTRIWRSALRRGQTASHLVWLQVTLGGVAVGAPALVDTGNGLREPISGEPVLVMEAQSLLQAGCLPPAVGEALLAGDLLALPPGWQARARLVPVRTVAGTGPGMLAIRPEETVIRQGAASQVLPRCWLALCRVPLHPEGQFVAIVPPSALTHAAAAQEAGSGLGV